MHARILRKWSLITFLVHMWITCIIILVTCCLNTTTMRLSINTKLHAVINTEAHKTTIRTAIKTKASKMISKSIASKDEIRNNNGLDYNFQNNDHHIIMPVENIIYESSSERKANISYLKHKQYQVLINSSSSHASNLIVVDIDSAVANILNVPNLNNQVINLYNNYNSVDYNSLTNTVSNKFLSDNRLVLNDSGYYFDPGVIYYDNNKKNFKLTKSRMNISHSVYNTPYQRSEISDTMKLLTTSRRKYFDLSQRAKKAHCGVCRRRLMRLNQLPISSDYNDYNKFTLQPEIVMNNNLNKLMIERTRRNSRLFHHTTEKKKPSSTTNQRNFQYHRQQEHKRLKRYCSARDPTQLALEAPTVFEGKIKSMSYDRRSNFSVTFEVKEVYKTQIDYKLPDLLRLQFTYSNTTSECDINRERLRSRGIIREELEQGRVYILFVKQITKGNFTVLGQPVRKSRRAVNAVRLGTSNKYAQSASIKSLTANRTTNKIIVRDGDTIRLLCKVTGQPPPKVAWFKDGKAISKNRKKSNFSFKNRQVQYHFIYLKNRSELIIKPFNSAYAGLYECRAKNKVHKKAAKETIRVEALSKNSPSDEASFGGECPSDMQYYCLNGATCRYFRDIHEKSCVCTEGFNGERCQEKTTILKPSTYQKQHQQCESYKGGFYC